MFAKHTMKQKSEYLHLKNVLMYYPLYCCIINYTVTIATELSHLHDLFNNSNDIGPIQQKRILLKIKQHAFLIISMYINNRMHASTSFIHAQYIFF